MYILTLFIYFSHDVSSMTQEEAATQVAQTQEAEATEQPQEMDIRTNPDGSKSRYINKEWIPMKETKSRGTNEYPIEASITIGDKTYKAHATRPHLYPKSGNTGVTVKLDENPDFQGAGMFTIKGV